MDEFKSLYRKLVSYQQSTKFFASCVSEGLIPDGIRASMNLALDVNDAALFMEIKSECNNFSSRVLDQLLKHVDREGLKTKTIVDTLEANLCDADCLIKRTKKDI